MLRVEMLSTGDEVLHGQIIDTNAAWLADYLFQQGVPMSGRETVGDSLSALIEILQERSHIADVLIVNGGLGADQRRSQRAGRRESLWRRAGRTGRLAGAHGSLFRRARAADGPFQPQAGADPGQRGNAG